MRLRNRLTLCLETHDVELDSLVNERRNFFAGFASRNAAR